MRESKCAGGRRRYPSISAMCGHRDPWGAAVEEGGGGLRGCTTYHFLYQLFYFSSEFGRWCSFCTINLNDNIIVEMPLATTCKIQNLEP